MVARRKNPSTSASPGRALGDDREREEILAGVFEAFARSAGLKRPVKLVLDDSVAVGNRKDRARARAACQQNRDGSYTIYVARKMLFESYPRQVGVLIHEIGHVLLMEKGRHEHTERDADAAAERAFALRVNYDGDDVQTIGPGEHPRPARLDAGTNPARMECCKTNPSNVRALAASIENVTPDTQVFHDVFDEDPEEVRQGGEVRHGRRVIWVGSPGKMIEVDPSYVVAIQGNQFDREKLAAVAEVVRERLGQSADGKPVFHVGYGTVSLIDEGTLTWGLGESEDEVSLDRPLDERDIGKLLYTVRDGNHRIFGSIIGGETKVWMNLYANQVQDVQEWRQRKTKPLPEHVRKNKKYMQLMKILDEKLRND